MEREREKLEERKKEGCVLDSLSLTLIISDDNQVHWIQLIGFNFG